MSRIGKKPIILSQNINVTIDGNLVSVKGPKGELSQNIHSLVMVEAKDGQIIVSVKDQTDKKQNSLWGLSRTLISNMVEGVSTGFIKKLEINGVGFKAAVSGQVLVLNVGFSHTVEYKIPTGIDISVEKNVITVTGIDKQQVGQVAAEIRAIKKPEPYLGKGIKYVDEVIRRKAGKVVKSASA